MKLKEHMSDEAKKDLAQQNAKNKFEEASQKKLKAILMKPSNRRSAEELEELAQIISQITFFKNKQIKKEDLMEIVSAF